MSGKATIIIRKIKDIDNPLLFRKEYLFAVIHDGQPTVSRIRLRDEISKQLGVSKDLVVVRRIRTEFGMNISKVEVHVYSDPQKMMEVEPRYILRRNGIISEGRS